MAPLRPRQAWAKTASFVGKSACLGTDRVYPSSPE